MIEAKRVYWKRMSLCMLAPLILSLAAVSQVRAEDAGQLRSDLDGKHPFGRWGAFRQLDDWQCIAKQSLRDGKDEREIFLYVYDSDGRDWFPRSIPNSLDIMAVYQSDDKSWLITQVVGFAGVKYSRINAQSKDFVDIEILPYSGISVEAEKELGLDPARLKSIRHRIQFVDGKLVAKQLPKKQDRSAAAP